MTEQLQVLKKRAWLLKQIRSYFDTHRILEVETPLLSSSTNTDPNIQSVKAQVSGRIAFLQTSPEFSMKRLLSQGCGSIFQICHAFRDEEEGRLHSPEFSLLEWYSQGFDYKQLMQQLEDLLIYLTPDMSPMARVSYFDCFQNELQLDLATASTGDCRDCVHQQSMGIDVTTLNRDQCLDLLISQVIAPQFKGFTFVYDYPASQASLAKIKQGNPQIAERFELFFNDMELANGFSELTDHEEQRARFEMDNKTRIETGIEAYPIDENLIDALENGMPECAGVALGLDRLLMVLMNKQSISDVMVLV